MTLTERTPPSQRRGRLHAWIGPPAEHEDSVTVRCDGGRVVIALDTSLGRRESESFSLDAGLALLLRLQAELPHAIAAVRDEIEIRDELGETPGPDLPPGSLGTGRIGRQAG